MASLRKRFVTAVYADHNASRAVKEALSSLLNGQPDDAVMLNIGAGESRLHPNMRTLELEAGPGIDFVGSVTALPMADNTVDVVVSQEVLEHVDAPFKAMQEIHRVLKPGGRAYIQLPFIIGYHPCPDDYWRFTKSGIVELARQSGFQDIQSGTTVGPATGFYRISVEFFAILFSLIFRALYKPAKGFFAILLFPIKLLDYFMNGHPEAARIAGGHFVVVEKG